MTKNETQKEMPIISQDELEELKQSLPKCLSMGNTKYELLNYQGFWVRETVLPKILKFQRHFVARDTDLIITGLPKTGTTWLKSLLYMIVNRVKYPVNQSPLLKNHPHEVVYTLENEVYGSAFAYPQPQHLHELPCPRLFSTHLAYTSLPDAIRTSRCRLLYTCRNPLDTLVSYFHFITSFFKKFAEAGEVHYQLPHFEDCVEDFCEGRYLYGPFFDHTVAYWKMSLEQPDKVLFLKYEDLKDDPGQQLKRVADFVGMSFAPEEEREGVVNQIVELCSIENMKELEVNKSGVINKYLEKKSFFRKGEVGEWKNYLTPAMAEKITKLIDEKLEGTGLSFKLTP